METKETYLWWNVYTMLPIRARQCRGALNHAGKSQRSAGGGFRSVMIRDPTFKSMKESIWIYEVTSIEMNGKWKKNCILT